MGFIDTIKDKFSGKTAPALSSDTILKALSVVIDPDLGRDIVALGFVRNIRINGASVAFEVNLTTPACPVKEKLKAQCEEAVRSVPGVESVTVEMTATTRSSGVPVKVPQLAGVKNIIAIASGKGGVGKSTTAVNLAFALSQQGARVGILDADIYGPSIPKMVAVDAKAQSEGSLITPPAAAGVKVLSAGMFIEGSQPAILRGPMAGNLVRQFLTQVAWGDLDYLIIDYPPGTGDIQLTISQTIPLSGAVIVTTPQEMALIDVRKAVSMFKTLKVPVLGVVETMSYFICDGCTKKHHLFRQGGGARLASELGVAFLGEIPMESGFAERADSGRVQVVDAPQSPASAAYLTASQALAQQVSILNMSEASALKQFELEWKQ